jgi:hypothetical protein
MSRPADPSPVPPDGSSPVTPAATVGRRGDASAWNLLLVVPIVVPLLTVLYNADQPRLLGFPRFYWLQLVFIVLGVSTTTLVYQLTKRRR